MTQPTVPQKDEKAEEEKENPPNAAGEQDIASKEAKDAEAAAADPDAKADEATAAKKASDEKEAEKKKSRAERKATEKAAEKAARAATKPPRVYEKGEPSTRLPKHYTWTDKDEMELLLTPIPKDESPQMLELRRIAILNQSVNLVNAKKHLQNLADEEEYKRHSERISVKNKKT